MKRKSSAAMVLAALGIVYGDIGTSPLYTLKETFLASHMRVEESGILGFVSLIIWALILVVTLKYVVFILHADDKGEGGVVVLMQQAIHQLSGKWAKLILLLGLAGTAMFFGDAMITPAVSVLSAAEGLTVINPELEHWVLPIALAVIAMLFYVQRKGTQHIGAFFGPVMLLWFGSLAAAGVYQIMQNPGVLRAVNPYYGLYFATHHGWMGFVSLGAVVLAVTGAEALYADMGHFGRKPIQTAWLSMVLPALALNYIGQGALLLRNPAAIKNPFFMSVPEWALIPMIVLATAATVIASQAVISGAFSLSRQAVQLGFLPRLQINHTSETEIGQIYIPSINWMLLVIVILVVLGFKNSTNLASAYGIAATGTMVLTTIMFCIVMLKKWRWPKIAVLGLTGIFLTFDLAFFSSNLLKLPTGGWFPVLVAGLLVFTFSTWRRGRALLEQQSDNGMDLREFVNNLTEYPPQTVSGNAVYMAGNPNGVPRALLHNLKHNKVLHEHNFLLTVKTLETPRVANEERLKIEPLGGSFTRITAFYGFKETPRIRRIMDLVAQKDIELEMADTSFFLSRDSIRINEITPPGGMNRLRARWFKWLYKNSTPATDFYRIPDNRAVELGSQRNL
ncbi:potassium transporter Kup [Neisseria sp.]|uniref:potassium transporter Kup n=1 Tax=Neisseria sp. TaxID=192066 RepID=UPI00289D9BDA|nr:potassium transporter Kup [Neisseria sp.]